MGRPGASRRAPLRVPQADVDRAKRWPIGQPVTVLLPADGATLDTVTKSAPYKERNTWLLLLEGIAGGYPLAKVVARGE